MLACSRSAAAAITWPPASFSGPKVCSRPSAAASDDLAAAPRHHDEGRADLPAAELVDRAVDPADQALLPVGERERLAGEPTLMQPELADEPNRLLGPAERVRDRRSSTIARRGRLETVSLALAVFAAFGASDPIP